MYAVHTSCVLNMRVCMAHRYVCTVLTAILLALSPGDLLPCRLCCCRRACNTLTLPPFLFSYVLWVQHALSSDASERVPLAGLWESVQLCDLLFPLMLCLLCSLSTGAREHVLVVRLLLLLLLVLVVVDAHRIRSCLSRGPGGVRHPCLHAPPEDAEGCGIPAAADGSNWRCTRALPGK